METNRAPKEVQCTTQVELNKAIANGDYPVLIGNSVFVVRGSAQVTAYGSAQVRAYGSAQVTAYGSAQVTAYDSAQVTATKFIAVTKHGTTTKVKGGTIIRIPRLKTAKEWCEFYGVSVKRGVATLFKALNEDFTSPHGTDYTPGTIPVASDWDGGERECGGGLHFSPRPFMALQFYNEAKKFVACPVKLSDITVHPNAYPEKVKASGCCGPTWECDIDGNPVSPNKEGA